MKPRITISHTESGELEIWLNEAGRDLLVKELNDLSPDSANDHFHLGAFEGAEVETRSVPCRPTDRIVWTGKVIFRTDEQDAEHFPRVLQQAVTGK